MIFARTTLLRLVVLLAVIGRFPTTSQADTSGDLFPEVPPAPATATSPPAPALPSTHPAAPVKPSLPPPPPLPSPPPPTAVPLPAPPASMPELATQPVDSPSAASAPSSQPAEANPQVHTALTAYASTVGIAYTSEKASVLVALQDLLQAVVKANTPQLQVGNPAESSRVAGLQERLCDLISRTKAAEASAGVLPGMTDMGTPEELPRAVAVRDALTHCTFALQRAATVRTQGIALAAAKARTGLQAAVQMALQHGDTAEAKRITGIEKDLGQFGSAPVAAAAPRPAAGTPAAPGAGHKVDLLKLVDVQKDAVAGTWENTNGSLQSDESSFARLAFAYEPPEEYDFHVAFSREIGKDCICLELVIGGHRTCWVMGAERDTLCRFDTKTPSSRVGPSVRSKPCLVQHDRYDCVIQVRKGSLTVVMNGKTIGVDKADGPSAEDAWAKYTVRPAWKLPDEKALGVGSYASGFKIYAADVQEISGPGRVLR